MNDSNNVGKKSTQVTAKRNLFDLTMNDTIYLFHTNVETLFFIEECEISSLNRGIANGKEIFLLGAGGGTHDRIFVFCGNDLRSSDHDFLCMMCFLDKADAEAYRKNYIKENISEIMQNRPDFVSSIIRLKNDLALAENRLIELDKLQEIK
jgi:hypothetical protein